MTFGATYWRMFRFLSAMVCLGICLVVIALLLDKSVTDELQYMAFYLMGVVGMMFLAAAFGTWAWQAWPGRAVTRVD